MSVYDMSATMDGLDALLKAAGVAPHTYAWPIEGVTVPCTVVGYPTEIDLGITFGRGGDHVVHPIWYIVGKTGTKDARDKLSAALKGLSTSVKTALDGQRSFGDVDVQTAEVTEVTIGAVTYLGAKFACDVFS